MAGGVGEGEEVGGAVDGAGDGVGIFCFGGGREQVVRFVSVFLMLEVELGGGVRLSVLRSWVGIMSGECVEVSKCRIVEGENSDWSRQGEDGTEMIQ